MAAEVSSIFRGLEDDDDDIFGDEPTIGANAVRDEDEGMDLFGDETKPAASMLERLSSPEATGTREGSEALSATELKHRKDMEYEEDDGRDDNVVELKHAMLSIPNLPMPRGSDSKTWVIRTPNFVKIDSKPFSTETYAGPEQSLDGIGEQEKSMSIKLEVENTIRWKWTKDDYGLDHKQSNSRIIRWSDGSLSLLLGKELFDINQPVEAGFRSTPASQGVGSMSQSIGSLSQSQSGLLSQSQSQTASNLQANRGVGLTYLVAQHKRPGILQAEAPIAGTMTLRPTGMQSEAHRKLARAVGQKHSRVARLRMAPENIAQEQALAEAERAADRKTKKSRKVAADRDELSGFGRRKRQSLGRRRESVWSDDDEPVEDWADEDEAEYGSPSQKRKNSSGGTGDGGTGGDYQTDDFLVADSSGDEGSGRKKKSRRKRDDEDGGADSLDELDAKIAEQEAQRRQKRDSAEGNAEEGEGGAADVDADVEMDVESEDEDEDFTIRRTGGGKKRAIAIEDEDD